jgi:hypothetical protein
MVNCARKPYGNGPVDMTYSPFAGVQALDQML